MSFQWEEKERERRRERYEMNKGRRIDILLSEWEQATSSIRLEKIMWKKHISTQ